ncbi:nucleotide exchange factor GrpE [bacterium]|nr:nucleotide exchange factor GrpE [bacterium]
MNTTKKNTSEDDQSLPDDENAVEVTKAFQAFVMEPLQKVSARLEGLEAELKNRDDRIDNFEERIQALEAKLEKLSSHLKQVASQPDPVKADEEIVLEELVIDARGLITQAMAEAQENIEDDKKSIELSLKNAGFWHERGKKLKPMLKEAAGATDEVIANSNKVLQNFPEELNKALGNSQQGLNIIGRMLQRLVNQDDRLESLSEEIELGDHLKELAEDEWMNLLEGEKNEASAQKTINKHLDRIKKSNYKLVSQAGELADKRQKMWLDFIGKQVLPVLDGIVDGKNHTSILIDDLRAQSQDSESQLSEWYNTYATLSSTLLTMLNELGVYRMNIAPGMTIDFERHEPSSVEADPEMENEQIKEISRDGYDYAAPNGDRQTLRVARVVVIKNND